MRICTASVPRDRIERRSVGPKLAVCILTKIGFMNPTLLLIPTSMELEMLSSTFHAQCMDSNVHIELCGFGPIVSAIRAAQCISNHSPKKIVLVGVAGGFATRFPIGTAIEFDQVYCYGIGAGSRETFQTAGEMGWSQWPAEPIIKDAIQLHHSMAGSGPLSLLSCCAASASDEDVIARQRKFPDAVAEDMEGFAVAVACRFANVPLRIARGISNLTGDRVQSNWRMRDAMNAVEQWCNRELFA